MGLEGPLLLRALEQAPQCSGVLLPQIKGEAVAKMG